MDGSSSEYGAIPSGIIDAAQALTILATFVERNGLQGLLSGPVGHVAHHKSFVRELRKVTNRDASARAYAKAKKLLEMRISEAAELDWCNYPMQGGLSLFEARQRGSGVRLYGVLVGHTESTHQLLVLLGAEDKKGRNEASSTIMDRCEQESQVLRASWTDLGGGG